MLSASNTVKMAGAGALELVRSEDFVEYLLFPKEAETKAVSPDRADILSSLCNVVRCLVAEHENGYMWHRDPFNITTKDNDSEIVKDSDSLPSHLYGITHFADNIEDEWFVVYLLLQLTKEIEGLVVRVTDNDGEFLLIEAADFLPQWADPETCQQRVYLYNGEVHMIPLSLTSKDGDSTKSPKIKTAINLIRTQSSSTRAADNIQESIKKRIEGYPERIKAEQHRATAYVPVAVAALLEKNPGLISHAVQAFCFRDPIDLKACRAMRFFPPENCVNTSVVFTRPLYAMIVHDKYIPDKRTGWPAPKNDQERKSYSLGVKVACGFEILVSQAKPAAARTPTNSEESESANTEREEFIPDRGWYLYLESLKKRGYFADLLEGSRDYNEKLKNAQAFYSKDRSQMFEPPALTIGQQIASLVSNLQFDVDEMKTRTIPPSDDETWLEVNPADLDKILQERYGKIGAKIGESSNPTALSGALKDFLNHVSGLDGVEFPGSEDGAPVRPQRGIKKTKEKASESKKTTDADEMTSSAIDNKINFDSEVFASTVKNILDFVIPEDSWDMDSDSDGSGLGSLEDETEMDLNQMKSESKTEPESEIKQFMDQMDRELASTTMGQSFEKAKASPKKVKEGQSSKQDDDNFDSIEDFKPVDIDMNALKNILESYKSQFGDAGPASNLLGPMGIHLQGQQDTDSDD